MATNLCVHHSLPNCPICYPGLSAAFLEPKKNNANAVQHGVSVREQVLLDGAALTGGDRNRTYGSPAPNLALQMALWVAYKAVAGDKHSAAHDAAMQHVFAKVARIASGARGHRDNYVDGATYLAIAFECDAENNED